jgi:beta-glucanase (GH16 family)
MACTSTADTHDEIDIELLGGDPDHWQTNIYGPSKAGAQPLWGVFGEIEDVPKSSNVQAFHTYTVDWNQERIAWSVDGKLARTLTPGGFFLSRSACLHLPSIWL